MLSPWLADGRSHAFNGLCGGLGHGLDGFGFALGLVDDGLLFTFRAGDEGLALAGGDVDLLLAAALGGGDQRALLALGRDLLLHGVQDFLRGRQVLDFVTQHLHTPVQGGFVNRLHHLGVDDVALFKGLVQLQLADHRAQRGLCQLGHRHDVVAGAVAGAHGVCDLKVQDAVHLQLGVVLGDANLAGHVERNFLEAVPIGHAVHKRHQKVEARGEGASVFAQAFFDPGVLLWNDLDGSGDEDDRDDQDDDGNFHGCAFRLRCEKQRGD